LGQPASENFKTLSHTTSRDWVAISPGGDLIAIVKTKGSQDLPPVGTALEIYSLNGSEVQERLFEDRKDDQLITEIAWAGSKLLYCTLQGFSSLAEYEKWQEKPREKKVEPMLKHVLTKVWSRDSGKATGWETMKPCPPGSILLGRDKIYVLDDLTEMAKSDGKDFSRSRYISVHNLIDGKKVNASRVDLPSPNYRWWAGPKNLVPMFASDDGHNVIVLVSSSYNLGAHRNDVPFLFSIDLDTGSKRTITPDSALHGLSISGDPLHFRPGNPVKVRRPDGPEQIVCDLERSEAGPQLCFRFGYFDLRGDRIREITIFRDDLIKAGVPLDASSMPDGRLSYAPIRHLTWTPDGDAVLFQCKFDVWRLDIDTLQAKCVAKALRVEHIVDWVEDQQLLVLARSYDAKNPRPADEPPKVWGLLNVQ
jgi:hypothetical protein